MTRTYALSIAGLPYLLTTGPLATLPTSSSPLWWCGEAGVEIAPGFLDVRGLRLSERARPLDGTLDVAALTLRLRDAKASSGMAAGQHLFTYLATRDAPSVKSSPLTASVADELAPTFTVGSGAVLGSPTWLWIEREAVRVTSIVSDTDTCTRGALGTTAVAHTVSADENRFPEVYTALPWVQRRKVVLWLIEGGVAKPLWVGFCVRAPRLSDDGATFDLACDPYLQVVRDNTIGSPAAVTRVYGYGQGTTQGNSLLSPGLFTLRSQRGIDPPVYAQTLNTYPDWSSMVADVTARFVAATTARGGRIDPWIVRVGTGGRVDFDAGSSFVGQVTWLGVAGTSQASFSRTGTREALSLDFGPVPDSVYTVTQGSQQRFAVRASSGFPSSWASSTVDTGTACETTTYPCVRMSASRDFWVDLLRVSTQTTAGVYYLEGQADLRPKKYGAEIPPVVILSGGPAVQLATRVVTEHWAWGLRRAALPLVADADAAIDWDWSTLPALTDATMGLQTRRSWTFDGQRTLGHLLDESCQLFGCTPVTRGARAALFAWGWPGAREAAEVVTSREMIGRAAWSSFDDGLVNTMRIASDEIDLTITDAGSLARYGPGRRLDVSLGGIDQQESPTGDPLAFARQSLGRMSLWSDPIACVRFTVPDARLDATEIGKLFEITDWLVPSGAGDRGMTSRRVRVVGREIDLDAGTITVEALAFARVAYGYAPCCRILAVVSSTVVRVASGYIRGGTLDYGGGSDGLGGDGTGAQQMFSAGDRVEFIERNTTTDHRESNVIDAITWTGIEWRLTLASPISVGMQTAIGGLLTDLRSAPFSTTQASQRNYMFVGDDTTSTIGGTGEPARPIAP